MRDSWKDCIHRQRTELAARLRAPLARLGERCAAAWCDRERLNGLLLDALPSVPYCGWLYALAPDGRQVCDNVGHAGIVQGHYGRDRSQRPYMQEPVPPWGFLLSDAYISLLNHRPALTALQVVRAEPHMLGYVGADFDLRDLPAADPYEEPGEWRQIEGDPAIRATLADQQRVESALDRELAQALSILDELLTERGVFQCQIQFASSQAHIWTADDPYRYRTLDHQALTDPDICLVYPRRPYHADASLPRQAVFRVLATLQTLRLAEQPVYLRAASINVFNGMVSLTFSSDGTHYMHYAEMLQKDNSFWSTNAA